MKKRKAMSICLALTLCACMKDPAARTMEEKKEATVLGNVYTGTYSGEVSMPEEKPDGEGTFTFGDKGMAQGIFKDGVFMNGEATDIELSITYGDTVYEGVYNGGVDGGVMSGEKGDFTSRKDELYCFYQGSFAEGMPDAGDLVASFYPLEVQGNVEYGVYNGKTSKGLPGGEGAFLVTREDGSTFDYAGEFQDGKMSGEGRMKVKDAEGNEDERTGMFTDGAFTPTPAEAMRYLFRPFCDLTDGQLQLLDDNADLFMGTSTKLPENVRRDFAWNSYEEETDAQDPYLIEVSGTTAYAEVSNPYDSDDIMTIIVYDEDHPYFLYLMGNGNGKIEAGKTNTFCILPLGYSNAVSNDKGGVEKALLGAAALVE